MPRPFDVLDIVKHRFLDWEGMVVDIYPAEDSPTERGCADVFVEVGQRMETRVPIDFLEKK
jgi:heat shock protein HspQ